MTTRAIVPNGDGEGSLGTSTAKWGAVYSSDPARGENSGQVPTTAWVQKLLADALAKQKTAYEQAISTAVSAAQTKAKLDAHPVGSYYWSNDSTSPATLFGGTWEALPAGYTLIAQGSGSDSFGSFTYEAGKQYGERMHKLTTDELPHIRGDVLDFARQDPNQKLTTHGVFSAPASIENVSFGSNPQSGQGDGFVMDFGKDAPHNNLPPVIASYAWRRTA